MNWFAHIFLASIVALERERDGYMIGSFLGDFLEMDWREKYADEGAITMGIEFHLAVDRYTDMHPVFKKSCALFSDCGSIFVDVVYDHFLQRKWNQYSRRPLQEFIAYFYRLLENRQDIFPRNLRLIVPDIVRFDWLGSYWLVDEVKDVFEWLERRMRGSLDAATGMRDFLENYFLLSGHFELFFEDVLGYTAEFSEKWKQKK